MKYYRKYKRSELSDELVPIVDRIEALEPQDADRAIEIATFSSDKTPLDFRAHPDAGGELLRKSALILVDDPRGDGLVVEEFNIRVPAPALGAGSGRDNAQLATARFGSLVDGLVADLGIDLSPEVSARRLDDDKERDINRVLAGPGATGWLSVRPPPSRDTRLLDTFGKYGSAVHIMGPSSAESVPPDDVLDLLDALADLYDY